MGEWKKSPYWEAWEEKVLKWLGDDYRDRLRYIAPGPPFCNIQISWYSKDRKKKYVLVVPEEHIEKMIMRKHPDTPYEPKRGTYVWGRNNLIQPEEDIDYIFLNDKKYKPDEIKVDYELKSDWELVTFDKIINGKYRCISHKWPFYYVFYDEIIKFDGDLPEGVPSIRFKKKEE